MASERPYLGYTGYDATDINTEGTERDLFQDTGTDGGIDAGTEGFGGMFSELNRRAKDSTWDSVRDSMDGTQDPYRGDTIGTLAQQVSAYAHTLAAQRASSDGSYHVLDDLANSSGSWQVDITTLAENATTLANDTSDGLPALVSLTYTSMPAMVIVGTLLIGLAVATAFGNFLVGLALFKYRNLRTVSNYLIGNLACSDFLLAMTILPLSAVQECLGHWVFGEIMCYFWLCTDVLYCTASIWNLCIIAFDRFTATLYPMWYREKRSPKQAAIYIAIVWIFSIAICIPPLLGWNDLSGSYKYDNVTNVHQCVLFQTKSYVIYSAMGSFYIPFIVTVFLYIRIFGVLYLRMNKMKEATKARKAQQARAAAPAPPTVNPVTAEATNPLCVTAGDTTGDIEMTTVPPTSTQPRGSVQTEELSSKSLFGSESEEDSSGQQQPVKAASTNGKVHKHKPHREKGDKSETMVIFNPNHNFTTDSEKDDVKIVVCPEKNGKNNNPPAPQIVAEGEKGVENKKNISSLLKPGGLFNHGGEKKKKRGSQRRRQDQREMRATIRMAIIIAFFCGCWIGFFTSYLVRGIVGEDNFFMPRGLDAFFFWLGYSNSAMNPILYTIFNDDFRRAFQKILGCYTKRRHGNGPAYGKARS
jgi:hypothetical protein